MIELSEVLNVYVESETGQTYRRVTSILGELFPNEYFGIPDSVLDNAAERGHETERLFAELLTTGYVESECREDVIPRLQACERFMAEHQVEYIAHQITVKSDEQQVAGTIDFELCVDGLATIVDMKCCASKMRTWGLQLGGYLSMKRADAIGVLQLHPKLNKNGFRWHVYDPLTAVRQWQTCYQFWKLNQEL